jgi:hypothetical protein
MAGLWLTLHRSQFNEQATDFRPESPSHRSRLACHEAASELISDSFDPQFGHAL